MKKHTFFILFFLNILLSQAQQNTMRLGYPIGHSSSLENILYSNDSKLILTISEDKKNIVWDVLTGRMLYVLPIQTNHFDDYAENQIFFASDNKQIISCTDNLLEFWDVKKAHRTKSISDVTFATTKKVQSEDLHYLLMLKNNGKLQLYNYESDKLLYEFKDVFSDVAKIEFSPLGNFIIINSDEQIKIFNSKSGTLHFQTNDYSQVRFSSDEKKIILENYHNSKIIDATSKKIIFESLESGFDSMYISSDGNYFSEFSDENLTTKDIQTNQIVASFKTDQNGIFSTDNSGNDFWITANPQKIEIFNILNSKKNNSIDLSKISFGKDYLDISEIVFSPDKKSLAFTLYKDIRTIVVDLQSNSVRYVLEGKLDTNHTIVNQNSKHYNFTTTAWNHNSVQYWNPQTMSLDNTFSGKGDYISETIFSPNQNYIAVHSSSLDEQNQIPNYITIFNVDSGVEIFSVPTQGYELLDNFEFHPKYDNLALVKTVTSDSNSVIELLNLKTHHKTHITTVNENSYFGFAKNGNYFYTSSESGILKIYDTSTTNLLYETEVSDSQFSVITAYNKDVWITFSEDKTPQIWKFSENALEQLSFLQTNSTIDIHFSYDDNYIVALAENKVNVYDTNKASLLYSVSNPTDNSEIFKVEISPKSNYLTLIATNTQTYVYDLKSGKFLFEINEHKNAINLFLFGTVFPSVYFTSDEKYVLLSHQNGVVVKEIKTSKLVQHLVGEFVGFQKDEKILVTKSRENGSTFWEFTSGKKLFQFFVFNKQPLWLLSDGYYFASKDIASELYYIKELQTIGFEQLDLKYNRPDRVLEFLGNLYNSKDENLINAYKSAWEKRVKKLNLTEDDFKGDISVPKCEIVNKDEIEYHQESNQLQIHLKASDEKYNLERFNIWVNEVPVFGSKGASIKEKNTKSIDTLINIILSEGKNKIEASVFNKNGTESYRLPLYVNNVLEEKEKLYFIGIGLDKYQQSDYNLNYSVKDIKDLSLRLKEKYKNNIEIDTLLDASVTKTNVLALKEKLKNTKVDDKVIISFSGHGLVDENLDYYLAMHNVDFNNPQESGLLYEDLEFILDGIPSRQKLLLLDACHSGELDKDETEMITEAQKLNQGLKGSVVIKSKKSKLGIKNSFELMKELFNNVDRATGTTIISVAAGTQFAQERGDIKNGVFTYCVLEQLKQNKSVRVSELKEAVSKQVQQLTNGLQQPTSRNQTIENDWLVW